MKIFLSGCSGTGKTTLAKYISARFNIPFIQGSSKPLWEKHDIASHADIVKKSILEPTWGYDFQMELLEYRSKLTEDLSSFVTDRSPLDNMVYFLIQNAPFLNTYNTEEYFKACRDTFPLGFELFFLDIDTEDKMVYENDGNRINNLPYQLMMNQVFKHTMETQIHQHKDIYQVKQWNWESRVSIVELLLKEEPKLWQEIKRMFGR